MHNSVDDVENTKTQRIRWEAERTGWSGQLPALLCLALTDGSERHRVGSDSGVVHLQSPNTRLSRATYVKSACDAAGRV